MIRSGITAVVAVYNRADLLRRMLATARAQKQPFDEIIVVDNASTDDAARVAREAGCRVIAMTANAGFARAVNAGWSAASTPWIAILNSDVEIHPEWSSALLRCAIERDSSFAAGLILDARHREVIDGAYDLVSRAGCAWRAGHGEPATANAPARIAIAPGTACLFRRDVLEALNGYDEAFESYLEDVDLGLRCLRSGFEGVFTPDAIAWHHGGATFGRWDPRVIRLISRNQLLLVSRHYDAELFRRCLWPIIAGQLLWGVVAARHGGFRPWLAGKWEGLRHFRLAGAPSRAIREFLTTSEQEIRMRARNPYWRWYFRLTARPVAWSGVR